MGGQRAAAPVLSGSVPPLAEFFHARQETGFGLADGLRPGETILLIPAMLGVGGTGKTQLAVGFAHAMWSARAVDLLVWVAAGSRSSVVAGYAQAAADLDLLTSAEARELTADSTAQRFLSWLQRTERRWAVMLDGVASPADLDGLWPQGPAGQVVVTSRLREQELGSVGSAAGVTAHPVPGFSRREALGYLNARLTGYPDQRIEALDLAEDVGGLPIALAQAAAVVMATGTTCRDYRAEFAQRMQGTAGTQVDGCPPALLATWSLAVEHAHQLDPAGLAWPALVFASVLDTGGIPAGVLTAPAAAGYITGQQGGPQHGGEQNLVRTAFASLERLGLISVDNASPVRTVWLHSAVRSLVRAYLAPGSVEQVVSAAANGLLEAWPEAGSPGSGPQLSQALRDNAAALRAFAGDLLWKPEAHPLLVRAGTSLTEAPGARRRRHRVLAGARRHQRSAARARPRAVAARAGTARRRLRRLRAAHRGAAGLRGGAQRPGGDLRAAASGDRDRTAHRRGLAARRRARARGDRGCTSRCSRRGSGCSARRTAETLAVRLKLADVLRDGGTARRQRPAVRAGGHRRRAGTRPGAPRHADRPRQPGGRVPGGRPDQGGDQRATSARSPPRSARPGGRRRGNDRTWRGRARRADRARHPGHQGRPGRRLPGSREEQGSDRRVRAGAGRPGAAVRRRPSRTRSPRAAASATPIAAQESCGKRYRTTNGWWPTGSGIFGADHRDTLAARALLAAAYQVARRMREAVETYEAVVADSERALGPGDLDTLTARCNLAAAYYEGGRMPDGIKVMRHALADCERYLGPDHSMTSTVRESLQAATE